MSLLPEGISLHRRRVNWLLGASILLAWVPWVFLALLIMGCGDEAALTVVHADAAAPIDACGGADVMGVDRSVSIRGDAGLPPDAGKALRWAHVGERTWPTVIGTGCRASIAYPAVCLWAGQQILIAPNSALHFPFHTPIISATSAIFSLDRQAAVVTGEAECAREETLWVPLDVWECMED